MNDKDTYCNCLYYSSNALARVVTRMAEVEFSAVDLAPSYAFVIMTVNKNPGIHAGELAEIMMLTPSTMTRLVDKLESRGLVKKHNEGRITMIYPTATSVEMNEAIKAAWHKLYLRIADVLGKENARQLTGSVFQSAIKLASK
ncbi:MAG: MarR family winged helix-turn-helix transcriptional regulator [Bacteroidota bacterium]